MKCAVKVLCRMAELAVNAALQAEKIAKRVMRQVQATALEQCTWAARLQGSPQRSLYCFWACDVSPAYQIDLSMLAAERELGQAALQRLVHSGQATLEQPV